jgi:uncharacterized protein (TIGR03437 family)
VVINAVAHAASSLTGAPGFSPSSIITLYGAGMAGSTVNASSVPLPTTLGGAVLTINGRAAPLFYVSPTQINAQLPAETLPGTATAVVSTGGVTSAPISFTVAPVYPGIFIFGNSRAVVQNQDFSVNDAPSPAAAGSFITAYLTGIGPVDNPVPTGQVTPSSPLARPTLQAVATIGGQVAETLFLGLTPGLVGVAQANLRVPQLAPGHYPLVITIAGVASNGPLVSVGNSPLPPSLGPLLEVSASSLGFGNVPVGQFAERTLTIRSTGDAPLTVQTLTVSGTGFALTSPPGTPFTLAAGGQQNVTVRFTPTAEGTQSGTLTVNSLTVTLLGAGLATQLNTPIIQVTPASLDFGSVALGQTADRTATVQNTGTAVLTVNSLSSSNPRFTVTTPTAPFNVAPKAQQIVTVRFSPAAAGAQTGVLSITSNAGPSAVALAGTGAAPASSPPSIAAVSVTVPDDDNISHEIQLADLDGDIRRVSFEWFSGGTSRRTLFMDSPTELNFAGFTSGTVVIPVAGFAGTARTMDRVEVQALDFRGQVSAKFSQTFSGAVPAPGVFLNQIDVSACPSIQATVAVTNVLGQAVTGLAGPNFTCKEDGAPLPSCLVQPAAAVKPLSVALVMDTGPGGGVGAIDSQRIAGKALVNSLGADDRAAIIAFGSPPVLLRDFTGGKDSLNQALDSLPSLSGAALYDALLMAVRVTEAETGRRQAIIVMSASDNTAGSRDAAAVITAARNSGIPVYSITFGGPATPAAIQSFLFDLSRQTGAPYRISSAGGLQGTLPNIGNALLNQYALGYTTPRRDGQSHTLEVSVVSNQRTGVASRTYSRCGP